MKKFLLVALLLSGLLGGLWWWKGHLWYRHRKEVRWTARMLAFEAKQDYSKAAVSAKIVLQLNPTNAPACRLLAELADRAGSSYALVWRQRLAESAPTLENRLVLAACALRYQPPPYPLAARILEETRDAAKASVAYHLVAARLAVLLNQPQKAEEHLQEATRLEPTNVLHSLNLAVLHLAFTNPAVAAQARATLQELGSNPAIGDQALRPLVTDSISRQDWAGAQAACTRLLAHPRGQFEDRVVHLSILRQLRSPELGPSLQALQSESGTNAARIGAVAAWMGAHGMATQAVVWLKALPASRRAEQPVPLAIASCLMENKDWPALEAHLRDANWGDREYVRLAMLSRALRAQEESTAREAAKVSWRKAVRAAADYAEMLSGLAEMARRWGWEAEWEEVLLLVNDKFPSERWAADSLFRYYRSRSDTRALQRLYTIFHQHDPTNAAVQNDLAAFSLLLQTNIGPADSQHTNIEDTVALAEKAYKADPHNCVFASTYAFALQCQGKKTEALAIYQALKPTDLERPELALYYGSLLAELGEKEKAGKYLRRAESLPLLPEEKALLNEAKAGR